MCGITGLIDKTGKKVSALLLARIIDAIKHRGPDGGDIWVENNVGLGHRRLTILDLSIADQPMTSADGKHKLVFNGEIYNFKELRSELEKLGHAFEKGDTEVVLNSLIEWGPQALERFNGMFALALWNRETQELIIGRDRYGIKPLYIKEEDDYFCFGSEQKAIKSLGRKSNELDIEAVYEYFTFQNIFTDKTLCKGISMFPAGHHETLRLKNGKVVDRKKIRYWDYRFTDYSES